jgi:hypothetical protein
VAFSPRESAEEILYLYSTGEDHETRYKRLIATTRTSHETHIIIIDGQTIGESFNLTPTIDTLLKKKKIVTPIDARVKTTKK